MGGTAAVAGRGRKPKPTAKKQLAGNPGKRALNKAEPQFSTVTNVDPPEWLNDRAADMWKMIIPELLRENVLALTDLHNVEAFCTAYGNWRMAQESINTHGIVVEGAQGGPMKNPALTAANETMRQMVTFGSLLGLDPASRTRLIGGNKQKSTNEFAALLSS
ncbi:phage terminase small subunit P27 family [Pseudomonas oryzihabitans]|jgi:P27 family predicted phage terminase small subunit|uniref:Phage terminase, small subunit, putative, P27 family n=1 Tax=Pseudomonas oryzihabitans TaxID=47885 RepID=A0A1G5MWB7_9PSED|nr:phage terminase small subunit P27 family [Pseudomonas psychrotolerans]KTT57179.1 terminase [Pseudomonas psychrotolerans]NMY89816.1 phage terminase small subunit P27 family [Pseudomonas psychrotolerans]SCZ28740.1 phage terminase, small subunit, putative, P27 family [Pseudomonas psychrotolerans]